MNEKLTLVPVYQFGDKICLEEFCNALVGGYRSFCKKRDGIPGVRQLLGIYETGLGDSQMAKFFLKANVAEMLSTPDRYAEGYEADVINDCAKNSDLMRDFMNEVLYQKRPYGEPVRWKGCQFHDHKDGSSCSAEKK